MVRNRVVPNIIFPNIALTDVANMDKWLYDLTASAPGDNVQNDQGNAQDDEMEQEMEQGDTEQQPKMQTPFENVAITL